MPYIASQAISASLEKPTLRTYSRKVALTTVDASPTVVIPRKSRSLPITPTEPFEPARKKSGELVKSSMRKSRSFSTSKNVRFDDDQLVQVRLFLKAQQPDAVHEDAVDDHELTLRWSNWVPPAFPVQTLALESVVLAETSLVGHCYVRNIAFQKVVAVRYTTNAWRDTYDISATYKEPVGADPSNSAYDRFTFSIPLKEPLEGSAIELALRYNVAGQEFWDNNNEKNYKLDLIRVPKILPTRSLERPSSPVLPDIPTPKKKSQRYDISASLSTAVKKPARSVAFPSYFENDKGVDFFSPNLEEPLPFVSLKDPFAAKLAHADNVKAMSYLDLVNKYCFYGTPEGNQTNMPSPILFTN